MSLPSPWDEFLREVDRLLPEPVKLHCIGGFVLTIHYGLPIPTGDVDYVEVIPGTALGQLEQIAGRESKLYDKYRLYFQYVAVVTLPEKYEGRLVEILPGEFQKLRIFIPDPYDLALSKLERNSPKDRSDVAFLAKRLSLNPETLNNRYRRELRPYLLAHHERHDDNLQMWLDSYFRQQSDPDPMKLTWDQVMEKVDEAGNILGFSVLRVSAVRQKPIEVAL